MKQGTDMKAKVNRIPPSTVKRSPKRRGSARKELPRHKRRKPSEPEFRKLDSNDPVEANRIQQRRKAITKGKNTVGYDCYLQQVPKEKRRPRSMETPTTPDHTLDIPGKRWNGLVRAWRIALHRYDPPDLTNSFAEASGGSQGETNTEKGYKDAVMKTPVQTKEQAKGLTLDTVEPMTTTDAIDDSSPISVLTEESGRRRQLDNEFVQTNIGWGDMCDSDDDDDDLL